MAPHSKTICAIILFAAFISNAFCINCYYCNSANNSACLDLTKYDEETRMRMIPVVNCEASSPVNINFFCRKIVQTIFHTDREEDTRVTRSCGWVRSEKECYRNDNRDHLETVCQCFNDQCNAADAVSPAASVGVFFIFAAVLYFYR